MPFMMFVVVILFTFLCSTSLAFQIPTGRSGSIARAHKRHCIITRSPNHEHLHNYHDYPFRDISLRTKRNEEEETNDEDDNIEQQSTPPSRNLFDSIWESQYFTASLFWAPFIFNPKLRLRFTNFLSEYLDLNIAIPVFSVGTVVAVIYVTYQNQLVDIELASDTTEESLRVVREIRRAQMGGVVRTVDNGDSIEKEYEMALENYDYALKEELRLRNTFFTLSMKIPNAPEGPDRAAAKQFLGMDIEE